MAPSSRVGAPPSHKMPSKPPTAWELTQQQVGLSLLQHLWFVSQTTPSPVKSHEPYVSSGSSEGEPTAAPRCPAGLHPDTAPDVQTRDPADSGACSPRPPGVGPVLETPAAGQDGAVSSGPVDQLVLQKHSAHAPDRDTGWGFSGEQAAPAQESMSLWVSPRTLLSRQEHKK